jgi:protein-disulfide isomerase
LDEAKEWEEIKVKVDWIRAWLGSGERSWALGVPVLLLVLAMLLAGCQSPVQEAATAPPPTPIVTDTLAEGQAFRYGFTAAGNPYKGNPDAQVVIEEYSSYQCPFCERFFQQTYPDLMGQYVETGQVLFVFNDFPLSGQPQSPKAAEAARCAGDVGGAEAYWSMHDRLFEDQSQWSGRSNAAQIFKDYASDMGLGGTAFDACLDSGQMAGRVQADAQEGMTRGVRGTPSFFINGQILVGAQPISTFAAAIDAAVAGETGTAPVANETPTPDVVVPTPAAFDFEGSLDDPALFALGDPDAPVTLVEFSDYQCPVCARHFEETWPQLKEQYIDTGRVYFVFQDFPLYSIHPHAAQAAEAARCAAQAGGEAAYWQMHDKLFEGQADWADDADPAAIFSAYAADMGLNVAQFDACLDDGATTAAVEADVREGYRLGVSGTPTFFVDGFPFSGALPLEAFDQLITLAENDQLQEAIAQAIAQARAQEQQQAQPRPTLAPADVPLDDAPTLGQADAPVTIVEYSDYQCPFCERHFNETLPRLIEDYVDTGKVRYVFKDFPLSQIHPQAEKAAEAARCARDVGGDAVYWQMHDELFGNQDEWSGNPDAAAVFKGYAADLGLDQAAFDTCLDSGRYAGAVQADLEEGAGFGVSGTPAFFINGQPVEGAQPYEVFVQVIEGMLAGE